MTHDAHRDAVVETTATSTDGKPVTTQKVVQEEGVDTMYVINWIVSIVLIGLLACAIVYFINRFTNKSHYVKY